MNSILKKDFDELLNTRIVDWSKLKASKILLTGSTGLIGSLIVRFIIYLNEQKNFNIKLILPVRDIKRTHALFSNDGLQYVEFIESDIIDLTTIDNTDIDYIIHGAAPTHSKFFITKPVETIDAILLGTRNILNIAKQQQSLKSLVILSSMEIYGVMENEYVTEKELGYIDLNSVRSSYPEAKRLSELMSYSFYKEYDIPSKIVRLAQTFGPGILENENRVFKQFCNNILNNENIILKSKGTTIINYCYTTDAILAIFKILFDGVSGEAYNVVNDQHMTIRECAEWLINTFSPNNNVVFEIDENAGFAPDNKIILSNNKLKHLGYIPKHDIEYGYTHLLDYLKEEVQYY